MSAEGGSSSWRAYFEFAGVLAVIAGLVLVAYELQLARNLSVAERLVAGIANEVEFSSAVADHADVWTRGCLGEELDAAEATTFASLIRAHHYNYFMKWRLSETNVSNAGDRRIFALVIARNVHRFPGYASVYGIIPKETLAPGWTESIDAEIERLRSEDPAPDAPAMACGM